MSKKVRRVVVTGIGAVSPLGDSAAEIHGALCEGRSGMRPIELFDTSALPVKQGGEIPFEPKDYLSGNLRPLDRTARLAVVAAQQALDQTGWNEELRQKREIGLVLGTMFGSVHTISAFDVRALEAGPKYVKPFDFANSVINAAAGQTAIWHHLRGINSTIAGGTTASLQALAYAVEMIRNGRADVLLAGGADELCFESFFGFYKTGRLAGSDDQDPRAIPFDRDRNGFALAEGAAVFMLEAADVAEARGVKALAEIRGHASAYDTSRGVDAAIASKAVYRTVQLALEDAGIDPSEVDAVSTGASGSPAGDYHEAAGLANALQGRTVPVTAVKSMLGESLGASGAFQTLALMESLRSGSLPGIRGLENVAGDIPLAGLTTTTKELATNGRARDGAPRRGLVSGLGLDGNVSALAIEVLPLASAEG